MKQKNLRYCIKIFGKNAKKKCIDWISLQNRWKNLQNKTNKILKKIDNLFNKDFKFYKIHNHF